jgi:DNA polymerase-1
LSGVLSVTDLNLIKQDLYRVKYANVVVRTLKNSLSDIELNLYRNIELPLVKVLVAIQQCGIKLDVLQLRTLEAEISIRITQLQEIIYSLANCVFNINSAKQLQGVLFNQLQLPTVGIKKNTNGFSTDEDTLKILAAQGVEIALYLIEYRGLTKLLNTYISKLPPLVDGNSRLHTTFEQALVASGRLSSKEPNLQNIPVKSDWGKKIRQAFIAKDGCKLICADYSQIELRILAHFSRDENLVNAFNTNQDIHTITASEIFHKPIDEVTKDERRYAKTINFSLLYGKTVYGLAQELEIDRATAKVYIDTYFAKYPKVLACLEEIKNFARVNGYVETVTGRRIYLPNINASNKIQREAEERLALNAPMQGTSADIIKVAMIKIHDWLLDNNLASRIILQVHDELILEVPDNEVELVSANLASLMSDGFTQLSVKLAVDIKTATNWDDAH